MPQVNTSDIQTRYNEQLARLYYLVEYSPDDVLAYVLSGVDLSDINIIVAQDVESLPNLQYGTTGQPDGMVYFVQSLGIIVISSNSKWLTLDGVTIRTDTVFSQAWSWGVNTYGRLGDNTTVNKSSPVSVVGIVNWQQVSAGAPGTIGARHIMGLTTTGTIYGWGLNNNGQLGTNTTVSRSSPVSVVGGFTDWCQVSAGDIFSLGLRQNGTAWAWGDNFCARLGNNSLTDSSSPVSVAGGFTNWCRISAGGGASLAIRETGSLWAWGCNQYGQIGDNTTVNKSSPVSVIGGFTDWCQISAGGDHSIALRTNGTIWGWGRNGAAALGDGTRTNRSSPVSVVGGFCDWCQISAGLSFSLAVRTNGTAWAWGQGSCGRLGDNTTADKLSPVSVVGGFTDWCQVSAGNCHSLGLRQNSTIWAWGNGSDGQLGDNTTANKSSPVSVVGGFCDWTQVSAGSCQSIGIRNVG